MLGWECVDEMQGSQRVQEFKAGRSFLVLTHSEHDQGVIPMSS